MHDHTDTRGTDGFSYDVGFSNKFLKLCIWQKLFITSSVGSEIKSSIRRKLSIFDGREAISFLIYSKCP